ncbi:MAG: group 1 truncated hemoglobin [Alphaproteobacteria bacterium]|nr:group 1 truncated hemoglobin [Alphaproteobacteria bacterium]
MKRTTLAVSAAALAMLVWAPAAVLADTLYERLGGAPALAAVVDAFVDNTTSDEVIAPFFATTDMVAYKATLADFLCVATGGPSTYHGRSMVDAHTRMNITKEQFAHTVGLLIKAMQTLNVPQAQQDEVVALLDPLEGDIVGR